MGLLIEQSRAHADKGSAICTNVVFVGTELAAFRSNTLQLFLSRRVRVANIHEEAIASDANPMELTDNLVADIARFKPDIVKLVLMVE